MAPTDYNVHDVTVRDVPSFGLNGNVTNKTQVTFFVGAHGPFFLSYEPTQATQQQIQTDIDSKVRMLRAISGEV